MKGNTFLTFHGGIGNRSASTCIYDKAATHC